MVQALERTLTFEEYLEAIPDIPDGSRYEIVDGVLQVTNPNGPHEEVGGFLALELGNIARAINPTWFIPRSCVVKPYGDRVRGYQPDVTVLKRDALINEPHGQKQSTILQAESIALVVEVASSNWRDDYFLKLGDDEAMGIPEYWIVDFRGVASSRFLGRERLPAVSIYSLVDGEYQVEQFRGDERLRSTALGDLTITANQVFRAGQ